MKVPGRLLVILLVAWASQATAEVYTWVDEDGKQHFSDKPPSEETEVREEEYELENIDAGYPPGIVVDPTRQEREQAERAQRAARANELNEACRKARANLDTLSGRVIFMDEDGSEVFVSEREREAMERKYRTSIEEHCGES